jgi:uncharacterized membrane protein YedE/YeeE
MLASFLKSVLWVIGTTLLFTLLLNFTFPARTGWAISMLSIFGGLLFGVGATINGGCAFSTLSRLGSGNLGMLFSLLGLFFGAGLYSILSVTSQASQEIITTVYISQNEPLRASLLILLTFWIIWELVKIFGARGKSDWCQRVLSPRYRLSSAAALMGVSNSFLYLTVGAWPYTGLLGQSARHMMAAGAPARSILWLLFIALLVGVVLSAWQGRRFQWQWRPNWRWFRFGLGGGLMGVGSSMIPGGNDMLILFSIPSFSPHAIPAFLFMLIGIAASLSLLNAFGREISLTDCGGDICNSNVDT